MATSATSSKSDILIVFKSLNTNEQVQLGLVLHISYSHCKKKNNLKVYV